MNNLFGNWRTSLLGLLAGAFTYAGGVGGQLPRNKQEWAAFGMSAAMAALGISAKDGSVGSKAV